MAEQNSMETKNTQEKKGGKVIKREGLAHGAGAVLLASAVEEACSRCGYRGHTFYQKVKGIEGLAELITMNEKDMRKQRGIGPKSQEVIQEIKRVILEYVALNVKEDDR